MLQAGHGPEFLLEPSHRLIGEDYSVESLEGDRLPAAEKVRHQENASHAALSQRTQDAIPAVDDGADVRQWISPRFSFEGLFLGVYADSEAGSRTLLRRSFRQNIATEGVWFISRETILAVCSGRSPGGGDPVRLTPTPDEV